MTGRSSLFSAPISGARSFSMYSGLRTYRSPSSTSSTQCAASRLCQADWAMIRPRCPRVCPRRAWTPGVSIKMIWASRSVRMPTMRLRVVCGLEVTMATFRPTSALMSVDLPALGGPMSATRPQRCVVVIQSPAAARKRLPRRIARGGAPGFAWLCQGGKMAGPGPPAPGERCRAAFVLCA